jgi:hypothetical protein
LNEIVGQFYLTKALTFINSSGAANELRTEFVRKYPELFQSPVAAAATIRRYSFGSAPILQSDGTRFTLPGIINGMSCETDVPLLFGVDRDVTCVGSVLLNTV